MGKKNKTKKSQAKANKGKKNGKKQKDTQNQKGGNDDSGSLTEGGDGLIHISTRDSFYSKTMASFRNCWLEQSFCDFTILVEGKRIRCHRLMLSLYSDFFHDFFYDPATKGHEKIYLLHLKYDAIIHVFECFYCGNMTVVEDELPDVLNVLKYFKIRDEPLIERVEQRIEDFRTRASLKALKGDSDSDSDDDTGSTASGFTSASGSDSPAKTTNSTKSSKACTESRELESVEFISSILPREFLSGLTYSYHESPKSEKDPDSPKSEKDPDYIAGDQEGVSLVKDEADPDYIAGDPQGVSLVKGEADPDYIAGDPQGVSLVKGEADPEYIAGDPQGVSLVKGESDVEAPD